MNCFNYAYYYLVLFTVQDDMLFFLVIYVNTVGLPCQWHTSGWHGNFC